MAASEDSLTIRQIIDQILLSRRITRLDQQRLMATALSRADLSQEEQAHINLIFDRLSRGLLHVVE